MNAILRTLCVAVTLATAAPAQGPAQTPDQPPPPVGSATEISFAASDVILLPE